jgi:flagellar motility protein MotE (MotC chaperone)
MNRLKTSWIISLLLTAINISFLISIFFFHPKHKNIEKIETKEHAEVHCVMHHKLELDEHQQVEYDKIKESYKSIAKLHADSLKILREELMYCLNDKDEIDEEVSTILGKIDFQNEQLSALLAQQYLEVKSILNLHQQEKLRAVYCDIFGCDHNTDCAFNHGE